MTVAVRGRVPRWGKGSEAEQAAQHIQERLQALERALAGGAPTFTSPGVPPFGSGPIVGPGGGGGGGGGGTGGGGGAGVTDHGALAGLGDHDHALYIQHGESATSLPHQHNVEEVVGLEQQYVRRLEKVAPTAHAHLMADVIDLYPDSDQFILASRVFGG